LQAKVAGKAVKQITFSGSNGSVKASDASVLRPIDTPRLQRIHTGLSMLRPSDETRTTDDGGLL
jgi:hypothetical protein